MNKIIVVIYIAFIIISSTFAQDPTFSKNSLGIKGGICSSKFTDGDTDFLTGITIGLVGDIYFYKNIGVSLEIDYTQKGGILRKITPQPGSINPNPNNFYTIDLYALNEYLEFPLWLKYRYVFNSTMALVPSFGISYTVPLPWQTKSDKKNQTLIEYNDIQKFTGQYVEDSAEINSLFGLNVSLMCSYKQFSLEIRYYRALDKIEGALDIKSLDYKFQSIQILLGYSFSNF